MTSTSRATRARVDTGLPAAGTWNLDPGHAEVGFVGRHLMLAKVYGRFRDVDATVEVREPIETSEVRATIRVGSVDTGNATRDDHLRSADLFDVDRHPTATFHSTWIEVQDRQTTLVGDLTIKGVTHPVELDVEFLGTVTDPWGSERAAFEARGTIDRGDWGVSWNQRLDSGALMVSREIELVLHVELLRQPEETSR